MRELHYSSKFKKQFKKYQTNPKFLERFVDCMDELKEGNLHSKWKNHRLQGVFHRFYELHLFPDILIIYEVRDEQVLLVQMSSHSDLF
jgi:mRNA interferase YafQ